MSSLSPRIYVACLASYNAGILHGDWIDAAQDEDEIWKEIKDILEASPTPDAEEHAIHDYEDFGDVTVHEYETIAKVSAWGLFLEEHGEVGAAVLDHESGDVGDAEGVLENGYGEYSDLGEYAQQLHEDCGTDIPASVAHYVDWDAMGRDMQISGDVWTIDFGNNILVFSN